MLCVDNMMLQVTTLVELIQQLRKMKFTSAVHDAFMHWADTTCRVDSCRRNEIANAINRHRTKNTSQIEKDKGFPLSILLFICLFILLFIISCIHNVAFVD